MGELLDDYGQSWSKLSRILATVLQFMDNVRQGWSRKSNKKPTKLTLSLKVDEIDRNKTLLNNFQLPIDQVKRAEMLLFRISQYCDFKEEIMSLYTNKKVEKSSHILKLRPVWDQEDSVIRMTGRSHSSSLILLAKRNRMTCWVPTRRYTTWVHFHLCPEWRNLDST